MILGVPETYESQNPPSLWPGQYNVKMTVGQNVSLRFTYRFGSHYTALSHDFPPGVLVEFWSNCMGDMQKVSKRTSTDITILFWFPGYKVQWHICGHVSHFSCKDHTGAVSIVIDTVIDGSVDLLMPRPIITWKRSFKIELSGHKHYLRVDLDTTGLCSCDQYINPLGKVCREDKKVMYLSESEQHLKISRIIWLSTRVLQPQIAVTVS